ncbi:MAG: amidase [Pseudomonadales bacterium]|nr:amidase [Pseudomonadales bacterium]
MIRNRLLIFIFTSLFSIGTHAQSIDVFEASIGELQSALENGATTSADLVDQYLARIAAYDKQGPALNSIVRINSNAKEQAAALDAERTHSGPRSLLHGIPVLVKDNYNTTDMPTTGGSVALANFVPSESASQVDLLLEAGAIIIAKTNLHEYAYGITSIASLLGQTRNPYDIRRVPGGSSGGTGAAVAASFGAIGMGSDTCGSIRIPSAFNNLIGLRPSKGLSSIYGIMPLSHTQDTGGPLARSVEDLAIVLDLTVGYDPNDEATEVMRSMTPPNFQAALNSIAVDELRIGKFMPYFENASGGTQAAIDEALEWYESQGAEIVEVELPNLSELVRSSGVLAQEFKTDLDQYLTLFQSQDIKDLSEIVDLGLYHEAIQPQMIRSRDTEVDEEAYRTALAARTDLREAVENLLAEHDLDVLAYPTITQTSVLIGDAQTGSRCQMAAQSGLPALSMPVGLTNNGLPVGMELLGKHFQDAVLLAIAKPYEEMVDPRSAPSVTPALENGAPPTDESERLQFNQLGASLIIDFNYSVITNSFSYYIRLGSENNGEVFAATLVIDTEEGVELNDPIVLNLLGPDSDEAVGEFFMSGEFREAYEQERLYLKVFADSLPVTGAIQQL